MSKKEFEIIEINQKLERNSLIYSEQLDEINKLNDMNIKNERDNHNKEEILKNEINSLKSRITEISTECEKYSLKISENINYLKKLDETKVIKETEFKGIQHDREIIALDYETKFNKYNELSSKINSLSISIKNFEQNKDKLNSKIKNNSVEYCQEINSIMRKTIEKNVIITK